MSYQINLGEWNSVFAVPSSLVDTHMRLAGAVQLKVLLWVLRHAGEDCPVEKLAAAVGASPADTRDAMQYWVATGLLRETGTGLVPPAEEVQEKADAEIPAASGREEAIAPESQPVKPQGEPKPVRLVSTLPQPQPQAVPQPAAEKQMPRRIPKPDGVFVAQRINESQEISFLMQEAQVILGRPISPGLSSSLLFIHDDYGLPVDVIVMLLQYVKKKGRDNTNYIESVAKGWASDGIFDLQAAEQKLRQLDEAEQAWHQVEVALRIPRRSPSSREEQFARRWLLEWKFSEEMLREAYDRCVDSTGRMNLSYINRILERWYKSGISTPQQAALESSRPSAAKPQEKETSFDLDEYERTSQWGYYGKE